MSSIKGIRSGTTAFKPVDESRAKQRTDHGGGPTGEKKGPDSFEDGAQNRPLTSVRVAGLLTGLSSNARTLSLQEKVDVLKQDGSRDISIKNLNLAFGIVQKYADQGRISPFGKNDNKLTREEFEKGYIEFRKHASDPNMATGLDEIMSIDSINPSWRMALGRDAGLKQIQEFYGLMADVADFIYRNDDIISSLNGDKLLSPDDLKIMSRQRGLLSE